MKAFRNNGVEGGYGTLKTQNWLLGLHRSQQRHDKVTGEETPKWRSISAVKQKPVKDSTSWRFEPDLKARAILLQYAESNEPELFGGWCISMKLYALGLLHFVEPPKRWVSRGDKGFYGIGAKFQIAHKGRQYIDWLKAKS